jgi:hypothetical protein
MLTDSFAEAGFVPVIDDVVVSASVLDTYRTLLRTRPLAFVELVPSLDVVRERDSSRDKHVFDIWSHLDVELRTRMPRVGLWLDNGTEAPDDTAERVIASLADAIVAEA